MTKLEEMARAIAEHGGDNWDACLKAPGQRRAGMYRSMALAALDALIEPSGYMVDAGAASFGVGSAYIGPDSALLDGQPSKCFRAMITAAKEGK